MMKAMPQKLLALVMLTLTGCSSLAPTPIARATPTVVPTTPPAITMTPTATLQPSATPQDIKPQCLDILPDLPADLDFDETLLFTDYRENPGYISDLRKGTLRTLNPDSFDVSAVSPDGKWLTYHNLPSPGRDWPLFLFIESVDGKQQIKIPWDKRWLWYGLHWLDNEQIMISMLFEQEQPLPATPDPRTLALLRIPSAVVINPFSGEQRVLPVSNYPDILWLQGPAVHFAFGYASVIYNPSLTLALYAAEADYTKSTKRRVVLWDMQAGRAIATLPGYVHKNPAFWSSAETKFLLSLNQFNKHGEYVENWFSLDANGHAEQLTRFEDWMDTRAMIDSPTLSPDGEAIAFWLSVDSQEERNLLVLNLKTRELTQYCFQVPASGLWGTPIWSLDGRFLMMTTDNPDRDDSQPGQAYYLSYLINLQQNWIVQINKSNHAPIGFVVRP